MPNSDVVATDLISARDGATIEATAPTTSGMVGSSLRKLSRGLTATDSQLALLVSATLFVLAAWPLALTEVPPYQDLPNHLAAVNVIEHPEKYPEFVFNGWAKTNTALFAWLYFVGKLVGVTLASRLFALLVLAANALVIPRFVLAFTGSRQKMLISALFAWPMIHNFFVSMGMLDFALGVPFSLALLIAIDKQRRAPTIGSALAVTGFGLLTWYSHVFPLLVVHMLVLIHVAMQRGWRAKKVESLRIGAPLAPVTALVLISLYVHLHENGGPMTAFVTNKKMIPAWELVYNLWAEWFWAFTKLELTTLVPCVLLGAFALASLLRREKAPPFFSGVALGALLVLYVFAPYRVTNWYHVNSRLIPFLFFAMLLRVPDRIGKQLAAGLGACWIAYSAAMGYDFVRLEKDRQRFTAGISSVPEGSRLLPLLFRHKGVSDNTRSLLHAWGFYVVEKQTAAPLLFAHSRSFPVMYSSQPPVRFNHLVLEGFAPDMARPSDVCFSTPHVFPDDCDAIFRARWAEFWRDATPMFDHVLLWEPTPEALAQVPPAYSVVFRQGELVMMQRSPDVAHTAAR
jgi:MFS family permease